MIQVALEHQSNYLFDRLVRLSPHVVRLRPAPHCRTRIPAYSLKVQPEQHFLNWQQDPFGNYLARLVFPEPARELRIAVDLIADMTVINPFDFFVDDYAQEYPFTYEPVLAVQLAPYLVTDTGGPVLAKWLDDARCDLVLTTGGTGPAPRDVTPEATLAIATKEMPGFGEQMRRISLAFVPTAILSRQVAVIRGGALVINLPGQPKAIAETLGGLASATPPVEGIFAAVPYCVDLIGGPYIETDAALCAAFRPKSALRPARSS